MSGGTPTRLTDAQRIDWLRLIRSENIGPRTFWALLGRYGNAARALAVLPDLARRGGAAGSIRVCSRSEAEREIAALDRIGGRLVASGEPDYPPALVAIDSAPPLLAVRGHVAVLQRPMVAIVGSRNASAVGILFTERLARAFGEAGLVVVSGLARGIDARAHEASLQKGTVAVLPGGQDHVYPAENVPLLERMLERGAVVTEMAMGWVPRGKDFPRRNRIVAGLAFGTVVVEAARRSGSLITARFANEQGREVFAVPGSPLDPRAEGTNDLLRQGATLCTRPEDVVEALRPVIAKGAPSRPPGLLAPTSLEGRAPWDEPDLFGEAPDRQRNEPGEAAFAGEDESEADEPAAAGLDVGRRVAALLGHAPIGIDDLARAVAAPVRDVQRAVLELELAGRLTRHGGNLVSMRVDP